MWREGEGMCFENLMKSGTFEVNGVAILGGTFPNFAKFVFSAVNLIPKMLLHLVSIPP